jgi:hypothetical protein
MEYLALLAFNQDTRILFDVRFEILAVITMKITVFWDVMPCSLVGSYGSGGTFCLKMAAVPLGRW